MTRDRPVQTVSPTSCQRGKSKWPAPGHSLSLVVTVVASLLVSIHGIGARSIRLDHAIIHTIGGPTLTNASMVVRDERVAEVGPDLATATDETVNLDGLHVFPGLIAMGTVLGLLEIDAVRATRDTSEVGEFTPDVMAWTAVNPDSDLIPVARANGVTHAEVVPLGGGVSGWSGVIRLDGWTIEDLTIQRAAALHVFWPPFTLDTTPKETAPNRESWKSIEDQVKERDAKLKAIDDFFSDAEAYLKARDAGSTNASARDPKFQSVPAWESTIPVLRRERPVAVHADELRQIRSAVEWARRRKFRMLLSGGRDAWRCADLLSSNQVAVVFEHVFTLPARDDDSYDALFAAPAALARSGVKFAFTEGTDQFGASNIRNIPYHAAQAMAFGLSRNEALRGLTLYPAEMLGVADRLGSIAVGKEATFFAADGDILDARTKVVRLWIAGKEVDVSSRHTRLYDRYRARPKKRP